MTSEAIEKVAKKIEAEIDSTQTDRNIICHVDYEFILCRKTCFYISFQICSHFLSNTTEEVLSKISQKLQQALPAVKNLATLHQ